MEYVAPVIEDYGTLVEMTGDQFLMQHFGIAAAAATLPATPGGGGDVLPASTADTTPPGEAGPGAVAPETVGPGANEAGPPTEQPGAVAAQPEGPAGGEGDGGGGAPAPAGATTRPGLDAADELPFTGLNVAATAAAGAAAIAAGVGLREVSRREASEQPPQPS